MMLVGSLSVLLEAPNRLVIPEGYLAAMGRQLALKAPDDSGHLLEIWAADGLEGCDAGVAVEADAAGRIEIPASFGVQAADSEYLLCGNGDHLELWSASGRSSFLESETGILDELFGEPESPDMGSSPASMDDEDDSGLTDDLREALERLRDQRMRRNLRFGANGGARFT